MKLEQLSIHATVVVAFASLAALVLTGQAGIQQDLRALQAAMLAGQTELREEMRAGQAELREEMRAGQAELREEIRAGQAALREEMRAGQAALREEIRAGQTELRAGQVELREDLEGLGVRLAVEEHRSEALGDRFAVLERHDDKPRVDTEIHAGSHSSAPPVADLPPPRTQPSR